MGLLLVCLYHLFIKGLSYLISRKYEAAMGIEHMLSVSRDSDHSAQGKCFTIRHSSRTNIYVSGCIRFLSALCSWWRYATVVLLTKQDAHSYFWTEILLLDNKELSVSSANLHWFDIIFSHHCKPPLSFQCFLPQMPLRVLVIQLLGEIMGVILYTPFSLSCFFSSDVII